MKYNTHIREETIVGRAEKIKAIGTLSLFNSVNIRRNGHARTSITTEYVCVSGETETATVIGVRI